MKALTYHAPQSIHFEDVPDPKLLAPGDAIVQVEVAAVCGSDLHVYHGREAGLDRGAVMGHEFLGRVVECGSTVRAIQRGDRVVAPFTVNCGTCYFCSTGLTARCTQSQLFGWVQDGVGLQGGQAELVRVPLADSTLMKAPDDLSSELALLLADVLPTGYHCAKSAEVEPGGVYAVVGCGPVGLMAVAGAITLMGRHPSKLFAIDTVPERLALAEQMGATPIDASRADPRAALLEATEGRGADGVMEAVGSAQAGRLAFELVRPGGVLSVVGVHHESHAPFSPGEAYDKNLTFRIGRCPARGLFDEVLPIARAQSELLTRLFTHHLPLSAGPEAYRMFDQRRDGCIKVVLRP